MKLPENKNERIKILAMIGIGILAVLYAILQLAVMPILDSNKSNLKMLEDKREEQKKMKRELSKSQRTQGEFDTVSVQVQNLSAHVIQPLLGTYLIGIQSQLEQFANESGLPIKPANEIGFTEIPGKNPDGSKRAIKSYGTRTTASGGYTQMVAVIRQLEAMNPLLCISELAINSQSTTPESHMHTFSIEWPVWAETEKSAEEPVTPPAPAPIPARPPGEEGP